MLTKMKKKFIKIQKFKIFKNGKNGLEIWWTATFPQNLALIPFVVSEKMRFTDDGRRYRTTDARATAIALLTQSNRAKNLISEWFQPLSQSATRTKISNTCSDRIRPVRFLMP